MVSLFRKNIDPRCVYCKRGVQLDAKEVACVKQGITEAYSACRHFKYDALKRIPPKPAKLRKEYSDTDFAL